MNTEIDSYFNTEKFKFVILKILFLHMVIQDHFGYRVRSKSIGNTTYTDKRSNLLSKPTPINEPVNKSDLNW